MINRNAETHFLNVDLDIYSRSHLEPLVEAFGKAVFVNYVGRERGQYSAHVSLWSYGQSASSQIQQFGSLIGSLPQAARKLWKSATSREFNIGIESGTKPSSHEIGIDEETVNLLSRINGSIVITTYAPLKRLTRAGHAAKASKNQRRRRGII